MTALSRGNDRLRSFIRRLAGILPFMNRLARTRKPVADLRHIPDSLKRDIGLLDSLERGRGNDNGAGQSAQERERNWQRHLDRPIFPPS